LLFPVIQMQANSAPRVNFSDILYRFSMRPLEQALKRENRAIRGSTRFAKKTPARLHLTLQGSLSPVRTT
jgi:hypothetical protein